MSSRFTKNVGWAAVSSITDLVLSFAIGITCARFMGNSAYGGLSTGIAIFGLFQRMITGGLGPPSIKMMGKHPKEASSWEASSRQLIIKHCVIWTPVALLVAVCLPKDVGLALAICAFALPATIAEPRSWHLQALLNKRREITPDRTSQLAGGLVRIALLPLSSPGWLFALGIPVSHWARNIILLKTTKAMPKVDYDKRKELQLKTAAQQLLGSALAKYAVSIAPLLLLGLISTASAGDFWAASRIAALAAFPVALYTPSATAVILAGQHSKKHMQNVLIASLICGAALALLGPWAIQALYGTAFSNAKTCVSILGIGVAGLGITQLLEAKLINKDREKKVTQATWISTALGLTIALGFYTTRTVTLPTAAGISIAASQTLSTMLCLIALKQQKEDQP